MNGGAKFQIIEDGMDSIIYEYSGHRFPDNTEYFMDFAEAKRVLLLYLYMRRRNATHAIERIKTASAEKEAD